MKLLILFKLISYFTYGLDAINMLNTHVNSIGSNVHISQKLELNRRPCLNTSSFWSSQIEFGRYSADLDILGVIWTKSVDCDQLPILIIHVWVSYGNIKTSSSHSVSNVAPKPHWTSPVDVRITLKSSLKLLSANIEALRKKERWRNVFRTHFCNGRLCALSLHLKIIEVKRMIFLT